MSTLAEALAPRSDQLNADDLIPGPRVLKITGARIAKDGRDIKVILNYEGDNGKPWKPCKTMGRAMVMAWSITEPEQFAGKSVRVYRDPEVRFGDQGEVGGIRISHMSDIAHPAKVKLTVSQGKKALFTFHPLVTDAPKQDGPSAAEKWVADHIAFVVGASTLERLESVQNGGKKAVDKLAANNPDLAKRVVDAYAKRLNELSGDDPFGLPPVDGRTDEQHGDQFPTDDEA